MFTISSKGSFKHTERFLKRSSKNDILRILHAHGAEGVRVLSDATPEESGESRHSWSYTIVNKKSQYFLNFHNSHMGGDTPIVILVQYGHATRNGSYIQGKDFINPAIRPVFDKITDEIWRQVTKP